MAWMGHALRLFWPVGAVGWLLFAVAACSSLSVSHLPSRPLVAGPPTEVAMKFWRFDFTGALSGEAYVIRGRATPVTTELPPWVDRVEELTFPAYCATRPARSWPRPKSRSGHGGHADAAVPFEFVLSPAGAAAGNYAVSFGYKAVYGSGTARSAWGQGPAPAGRSFSPARARSARTSRAAPCQQGPPA